MKVKLSTEIVPRSVEREKSPNKTTIHHLPWMMRFSKLLLRLPRKVDLCTYLKKKAGVGKEEEINSFPNNKTEALDLLESSSFTPKTTLGREMLSFLRSVYLDPSSTREARAIEVTAAGSAVQRSTLTFSLRAYPGDLRRAWEIPAERTYATDHSPGLFDKASRLDEDLISKMKDALSKRSRLAKERAERHNAAKEAQQVQPQNEGEESGDSDDDIFGGVGDYDPTEAKDDEKEVRVGRIEKRVAKSGGIFEGDKRGADEVASGPSTVLEQDEPTSSLPRLSSTSGYMEDMDTDFTGRFQDDDSEEDSGKKKKRKKSRKEGHGSDNADPD